MTPSFLEKLHRDLGAEPSKKKPPEKPLAKEPLEKKPLKKKLPARPEEAQLVIDVYRTASEIVIITPIAKANVEDIEIFIEDDLVTIKGTREAPEVEKEAKEFLYQECHWGPFSRQVILPEEVDRSRVRALLKDGILTLRMSRMQTTKRRKIIVKEEK